MSKYRVWLQTTVSTSVVVEADDREAAIDEALAEGVTGLMFLDHTYPDVGDWDVDEGPIEEAVELIEDVSS